MFEQGAEDEDRESPWPDLVLIDGGQGQLKGRILRIAHCGYFGAFDVLVSLSGLELALHELGADVELGAGVAAAQQVFAQAGVPVG